MALNTGKLAGKTLFVTGASRGIGKAIALKAAADGANVVIAAKTAEPHPSLPGTIFTACQEIEKAGGKCLPAVVDVRDEKSVQDAVEKGVKKFGGIDILINNASAISLTGTLDTPMKRYDLMNHVNARGTYLASQKCLPYLKQAKNPHILNLSPPLNMHPGWFKNHTAYTMAKYGMSMCVLGMSEEFRESRVAVNALWPKTAIYTAAMEMLGGGEGIKAQCRTVDIMSDAAYVILGRESGNYTGQFYVDEDVLRDVGVTDFSSYACEPGHPLLPDFFLGDPTQMQSVEPPGAQPAQPAAASDSGGGVAGVFERIQGVISPEHIAGIKASFVFNLTGAEPGSWFLDLKTAPGAAGQGDRPPSGDPDVSFAMDSKDMLKMFKGELKPANAFFSGKMKMQGPMAAALKLDKLLGQLHRQSKL